MPKILATLLIVFSCFGFARESYESQVLRLAASKYQLTYDLDLENQSLSATGTISVRNISNESVTHIPLRLYRMLSVSTVTTENNKPLEFTQQILSHEDWPVLQSNNIEIDLPEPIHASGVYTFNISFSGSLRGYQETGMNYVKDNISEEFSIIRMDAFAYPLVLYPNDNVNKRARFWLQTYDYDVTLNVPKGYVVANGGQLMSHTLSSDSSSYRFTNKLPSWRMDFTVAKYRVYQKGLFSVYSWEASEESNALLSQIHQTFQLYTDWFGPLKHELGYTFIEVPENYGAQADITAVIQDAAGFNELERVYHEISHQWNAKSLDRYPSRWNEGLATFLQSLVKDQFGHAGYLQEQTSKTLGYLKETFQKRQAYHSTGLLEFGKEGLDSYNVGMMFFHLLYDLAGQTEFNRLIGGFYQEYYESGATTEDFIKYAINFSKVDVEPLFSDWFKSANYVQQVEQSSSYEALLSVYQHGSLEVN